MSITGLIEKNTPTLSSSLRKAQLPDFCFRFFRNVCRGLVFCYRLLLLYPSLLKRISDDQDDDRDKDAAIKGDASRKQCEVRGTGDIVDLAKSAQQKIIGNAHAARDRKAVNTDENEAGHGSNIGKVTYRTAKCQIYQHGRADQGESLKEIQKEGRQHRRLILKDQVRAVLILLDRRVDLLYPSVNVLDQMHFLRKFYEFNRDISDPPFFLQDQNEDCAEHQKDDESDHDQSLCQRCHPPVYRRADRKSDHADDRQRAGIKEHIQNEDDGRLCHRDPVSIHKIRTRRLARGSGRCDRGEIDICRGVYDTVASDRLLSFRLRQCPDKNIESEPLEKDIAEHPDHRQNEPLYIRVDQGFSKKRRRETVGSGHDGPDAEDHQHQEQ